MADDDFAHADFPAQVVAHEIARRQHAQVERELDHDHAIDSRHPQQFKLVVRREDQLRSACRDQQLGGQRIERECERGAAGRAGAIDRGFQNRAMPEVDAIEISDRGDRVGMALERVEVANYFHSIFVVRDAPP